MRAGLVVLRAERKWCWIDCLGRFRVDRTGWEGMGLGVAGLLNGAGDI